MKRIIIATLLFVAVKDALAQNTFPSSGNVGIGTTSPNFQLHINSSDNQLMRLTSTNGTWLDFESANAAVGSRIWSIGHVGTWNKFGIYQRDGTNQYRFLIDQNGNIGIGTTSPYIHSRLHIKSPSANGWGIIAESSANDRIVGMGHDGNTAIIASSYLNSGGHSPLQFRTQNISRMTVDINGNVGIGTTNPKSKLAVEGEVRATRVKVLDDISVPDYVFEENYELRTLEETKAYITTNKHLPEIPSAAEIGKEGIDLGDMNMRLLKKIEELTLYQIELMEEMREMKKELEKLK